MACVYIDLAPLVLPRSRWTHNAPQQLSTPATGRGRGFGLTGLLTTGSTGSTGPGGGLSGSARSGLNGMAIGSSSLSHAPNSSGTINTREWNRDRLIAAN
ncbi:MAG: hypothetical protein VB934_08640 [Polyangiaceae bacterium]